MEGLLIASTSAEILQMRSWGCGAPCISLAASYTGLVRADGTRHSYVLESPEPVISWVRKVTAARASREVLVEGVLETDL